MKLSKYLERKIRFKHILCFNIISLISIIVVGWFRLKEIIVNPWYMDRVELFWGAKVLTNYFWGSLGMFVIIFFIAVAFLIFNVYFFLFGKRRGDIFTDVQIKSIFLKKGQLVINIFRSVVYVLFLIPIYFLSEPIIYARTLLPFTLLYPMMMFFIILSHGLQLISMSQKSFKVSRR